MFFCFGVRLCPGNYVKGSLREHVYKLFSNCSLLSPRRSSQKSKQLLETFSRRLVGELLETSPWCNCAQGKLKYLYFLDINSIRWKRICCSNLQCGHILDLDYSPPALGKKKQYYFKICINCFERKNYSSSNNARTSEENILNMYQPASDLYIA